jgi:photosystem II stability/assembly factor-like uncharacterized protein
MRKSIAKITLATTFATLMAVALDSTENISNPVLAKLIGKDSVAPANNITWYSVAKNKIFYSSNYGETWNDLNAGLPDTIYPIRLYSFKNKIYLSTFSEGLFVLNKNDNTWKSINSNLFLRQSFLEQSLYRKISAFTVDDKDDNHLFVATKYSLYESTDGGLNWKSLLVSGLSNRVYITALHYSNGNLYLGTSYDGFYKISGDSALSISTNLPYEAYSKNINFFEQISVIKSKFDSLYLGLYFGAGAFHYNKNEWKPVLDKSNFGYLDIVDDIDFIDDKLFISCGGILYSQENGRTIKNNYFKNILVKSQKPDYLLIDNDSGFSIFIRLNKANFSAKSKNEVSSAKKAIYTPLHYINDNLDLVIKQLNNSEINSVVIDMKDDNGNVLFNSKNATAIEINAIRANANVPKILKALKDNNIYAIARLVTFKDPTLFSAYSGKYTIKNINTGRSWQGTPTEFWVDPHSEFVRNYNISIAKELQDLGFDEIQFDYIRFPWDGDVVNCNYSFKNSDIYKSEVITDFAREAKRNLSVPVSVDIFGFYTWYFFGGGSNAMSIGQDVEELSAYVDVICPMVYPSHFGNNFYSRYSQDIKPYKIVLDGGFRAVALSNSSVSIRPYLQGFNYISPTWGTGYILHQINGARESNNDGYTFWNPEGDYKMVFDALRVGKSKL